MNPFANKGINWCTGWFNLCHTKERRNSADFSENNAVRIVSHQFSKITFSTFIELIFSNFPLVLMITDVPLQGRSVWRKWNFVKHFTERSCGFAHGGQTLLSPATQRWNNSFLGNAKPSSHGTTRNQSLCPGGMDLPARIFAEAFKILFY